MLKFWNKIKKAVYGLLYFCAAILFVIGMSAAMKKQNSVLCKDVDIKLDYKNGMGFVDEEDIRDCLVQNNIYTMAGQPIHELDLSAVEKALDVNPFIAGSEVYSNSIGDVIIRVSQKEPIIRIINKARVSYYLTENKELMPLSDIFTVRLLVVTGNIRSTSNGILESEVELFDKLLRLAEFLEENKFWKAMISQVEVISEDEFELIPILGKHEVEFGDIDEDMELKFENLKTLYKEGMRYTGWSQYKRINLKYKNQIVCTKI